MQLKESVQALTAEIAVLRDQVTDLPGKVKAQEQLLANTKAQIIENRDMLTAVSRYISRRAELVFEAVKMNRVSISLYDVAKSTGEVRDVFKFNYEDRPYICLSHSEKIRAGLEVSELIKRIAGVNFPVFIDDILKQELHDLDEQFTSLRYLSDELQIRARGLRAQKRAA